MQKEELERRFGELYIDREIDSRKLKSTLIKVIIGPRRVGKSFFAVHALKQEGTFGYANFDDERLLDTADYDEILEAIKSIYGNPHTFLLDEVQNLDKWELFVNRLYRQGYNLFITGSNSRLLSAELATHLTGRHLQITLFPFSFREFLKLGKKEHTENEIKSKLSEYVLHGGYPEPATKKLDYKDYLSTLLSSSIYKDIVKRHKIRSAQSLEDLALYLASNVGKELSYNTLSKMIGKSVHTVEKYLKSLEETFLFFRLRKFSSKVKEQVASNKKIFCIDNGFISSAGFSLSSDKGRLYENIVAIELKHQEMNGKIGMYYWKSPQSQEEVDFVVKKGPKITELIQVCYDLKNTDTKKREVKSLINASKELKCNNLMVITPDYESEETVEWFKTKRKIKFVPLWKWLLAQEETGSSKKGIKEAKK